MPANGILHPLTIQKINGAFEKSKSQAQKLTKALKSKTDDSSGGGGNASGASGCNLRASYSSGHAAIEVDTVDLDFLIKVMSMERLRALWKKKHKSHAVDVLMESANIAENIIQGGKEFGRTLIRGVQNHTVAHPQLLNSPSPH